MLRTPEDWCKIKRVEILDPDGWRTDDAPAWDQPIDEAEFLDRLSYCTQRRLP